MADKINGNGNESDAKLQLLSGGKGTPASETPAKVNVPKPLAEIVSLPVKAAKDTVALDSTPDPKLDLVKPSTSGWFNGFKRFLGLSRLWPGSSHVDSLKSTALETIISSVGGGRLEYLLSGTKKDPKLVIRGSLYDVAAFMCMERARTFGPTVERTLGRCNDMVRAGLVDQIARPVLADMVDEIRWTESDVRKDVGFGRIFSARHNSGTNIYEISFYFGEKVSYWQESLDEFSAQDVRDLEEKLEVQRRIAYIGEISFTDFGSVPDGGFVSLVNDAFNRMIKDVSAADAEFLTQLLGKGPMKDITLGSRQQAHVGIRTIPGSRPELLWRFIEKEPAVNTMPPIINISTWIGVPSDDGKKIEWIHDSTDQDFAKMDSYAKIIKGTFAGVQEHIMIKNYEEENWDGRPPGPGGTPAGTIGGGPLNGLGTPSSSTGGGASEARMIDGAGLFGFGNTFAPAQSPLLLGQMPLMFPMFRAI